MFSVQVGEMEDDATAQKTLQNSSHTRLLKKKKKVFLLGKWIFDQFIFLAVQSIKEKRKI